MRVACIALAGMLTAAGCRSEQAPSPPSASRQDGADTAQVAPFRMGAPDVVLLITGGGNGRLEIASCCGMMPGGLSFRSGLLASYRAAYPGALLIDTGDALWIDPNDVRNDFVLEAYRRLGYDLLALGDQEWSAAPARLSQLLAGGTIEYLSTTVRPAGEQAGLPVREVVRRDVGAAKLAFLTEAGPESTHLLADASRRIQEAPGRAAELARQLKAQGCLVVLLAHGDDQTAARAAAQCPADLIVRGHTSQTDANLLELAGRPMVKVGGADWVGVVALKVSGGRIAAIEYRAEVLDYRWPPDDGMVSVYKAYTHASGLEELNRGRTSPLTYVSPAECGRCHAKPYESWKNSPHASAYATLVSGKHPDDATCLACHTSGMGSPGGFVSLAKTPDLVNVNCQDCHRFTMEEHHAAEFKAPPVSTASCQPCHTNLTDSMMEIDPDHQLRQAACKGK